MNASPLKHLKHFIVYFIIHAVIIVAVVLAAIRFSMPYVSKSLPKLETMVSEKLGVNIKVGTMDSGWRGLAPVLRFEDIAILNVETHQALAHAHYLDISLDLLSSIRHWKFVPGRLSFEGLALVYEQLPDGSFRLKNHSQDSVRSIDETLGDLLTRFPRLEITNSQLEFLLNKEEPIDLHVNHITFSPRRGLHRFEADITGDPLFTRLKVVGDIDGPLNALMSSEINGYIHLSELQFDKRLMPWDLFSIRPQQGTLQLDTWFEWRGGHWHELIGKVLLKNTVLQNMKNPDLVLPMTLEADIAWEQQGGDFWRVSGDEININIGGEKSPTASFLLDGGGPDPWNLRLSKLAIDDILDLLTLSDQIDQKTREAIGALNPQGELRDIQWLATPSETGLTDWRLGMRLDDLYWSAYKKIPAVSHISGEILLTEKRGQFTVDSQHFTADLPTWYTAPLTFDSVTGLFTWEYDKTWTITSTDLSFVNSDVQLDSTISVFVPEDTTQATLDIKVSSGEIDQQIVKKYLPTQILAPAATKWINESVQSGAITSLNAVIKGPAKLFPFKKGEGELDLRMPFANLLLRYHPDWPAIHDLSGVFVLENGALQAYIDKGFVDDIKLVNSSVLLPFSKAPDPLDVQISGLIEGTTEQAENFLRASPLWKQLGATFELVKIRGPLHIDFKTKIPLRADTGKPTIKGKATLSKGSISIDKWNVNLDDVNGYLNFTENTVNANNIKGTFLGRPGTLTAHTVTVGDQNEITWNFHSILNKAAINTFARSDYWNYLEGESEMDASFKVMIPKRDEPIILTLKSDLKGIAMNAPAPIGKTADKAILTNIILNFSKTDAFTTEFKYGQFASGQLNFVKAATGYRLNSGKLIGGGQTSSVPMPAKGVLLTGHLKQLVVQNWTDFFEKHQNLYAANSGESSVPLFISDFKVDELLFKDMRLNRAHIGANKTQAYWVIDLNSKEVQGTVQYPHDWKQSTLLADFSRCTWPLSKETSKPVKSSPRDLHATEFRCNQFTYKGADIGTVQVNIKPQQGHDGVNFDPIIVQKSGGVLTAVGSWIVKDNHQISRFKGSMESEDIGTALRAWGLPTDVEEAMGEGSFELRWPGSPRDIAMKNLSGEVELYMEHGRFIGVNPGFGRMLGLLSFQGLARRLRFDFSDVFKEGFAFDTFKSNISIAAGLAKVNYATLKAPAADINITGTTNLATHALDLVMLVQAHIDSTLPAAAVAIANPAAGAAVWIVDKVFNPLGSVSRYKYHVTGTWDKPEYADLTKEYRADLEGPATVKDVE